MFLSLSTGTKVWHQRLSVGKLLSVDVNPQPRPAERESGTWLWTQWSVWTVYSCPCRCQAASLVTLLRRACDERHRAICHETWSRIKRRLARWCCDVNLLGLRLLEGKFPPQYSWITGHRDGRLDIFGSFEWIPASAGVNGGSVVQVLNV